MNLTMKFILVRIEKTNLVPGLLLNLLILLILSGSAGLMQAQIPDPSDPPVWSMILPIFYPVMNGKIWNNNSCITTTAPPLRLSWLRSGNWGIMTFQNSVTNLETSGASVRQ